jgi:hypothetical protein
MRGTKDDNLTGLRQRISTLFLQYIKTPTFNPGVVRHLKVFVVVIECAALFIDDIHLGTTRSSYVHGTENTLLP